MAVKCIERSRLNKASTENLFTEIKVMKDLKHDHIVKLEDFEVSCNCGMYVPAPIEGHSYSDIIIIVAATSACCV